MAELPHICAVITNLADDLALVDRMADAIRGEMVRRQELLRAAGNFASVRDYEMARVDGADAGARCRRCWSSSTSSASCCRPGRSSSTCS